MDAKTIALKVIDEAGLRSLILEDLLDGVVKVKLDELVAKTDNSLDDALVAMIYPLIREEVAKFFDAQLAKLQA